MGRSSRLILAFVEGRDRRKEDVREMVTIKRSPELEEFARERIGRLIARDDAWFEGTTAHGEVLSFGTAPDEQLRGREAVLAFTMDQMEKLNTPETLAVADAEEPEGDTVEAYEAGDTGWIVTHDRHTLDDGSWVAHRNVTVVVRDPDGGGWKRVLAASQLLVPNDFLLPGSPLLSPASSKPAHQ
jgi:SnoaL-like domain